MEVPGFSTYTGCVPEAVAAAVETWLQTEEFTRRLHDAPGLEPTDPPRQAAQYGAAIYDYPSKRVMKSDAYSGVPAALMGLMELAQSHVPEAKLDQCIVNVYRKGEGIAAHVDHEDLGPVVAAITLGTDRVLRLTPATPPPGNGEDGDGGVNVELARRSLYVMRDDARSLWRHSMPRLEAEDGPSYSITFRATADPPLITPRGAWAMAAGGLALLFVTWAASA